MTPRKITLLSIMGVLIIIHLCQIFFDSSDSVKEIKIKEKITCIQIDNRTDQIQLEKKDEQWKVQSGLPVKLENAEEMCKNLSGIKVIDTVAKNPKDTDLNRYGLNAPIKIVSKANEKILSSILVGKTSSTGNQTYIQYEGKKEIYLVSGDYNSIFGLNENELLDLTLYSVKAEEIYKVKFYTDKTLIFDVEKSGEAANFKWKTVFSEALNNTQDAEFDSEKIESWVSSITKLNATEWIEDFSNLDLSNATNTIIIGAAGKDIQIQLFEFTDSTELTESTDSTDSTESTESTDSAQDKEKIICICSENSYPCYISKKDAEKLKSIF